MQDHDLFRPVFPKPFDPGLLRSVVFKRTYMKMFFGLLMTAAVSLFCTANPGCMAFFAAHSWVMWALLGAELLMVAVLSAALEKLSAEAAIVLFLAYAALNGLTLAPLFLVYTASSMAMVFLIAAMMFGAMSLFGYLASTDLSGWGKWLSFALLGLVFCSLLNAFVGSGAFEWLLSVAGILVFVGLTAWDTQKIKRLCGHAAPEDIGKISTLAALMIYLDFLNLVLFLLRLFGKRQ